MFERPVLSHDVGLIRPKRKVAAKSVDDFRGHTSSQEKLAAAALTRLLKATLVELDSLPSDLPAADQIEHMLRWSLRLRLSGGVPHLPSTSVSLQRSLMLNLDYLAHAMKVNKRFYALVAQARADGKITPAVPDDVVVFTLYSRACDPTIDYLVKDKKLSHEQIVEATVNATIGGFLPR